MRLIIYKTIIFILLIMIAESSLFAGEQLNDGMNKELIGFGFYAQEDNLWFGGDIKDTVQYEVNFKNGVNIPRARFNVSGTIRDWFYVFTYDAAEENLRENFLRYLGIKNVYITVGQYKPAYSLWFTSPHRFFFLIEEGLPVLAFVPRFRVGAQILYFHDPVTFTLGVFGPDTANRFYGNQVKGHTPLAANARFTFVPINCNKHILHFGIAALYQETDSTDEFRFRSIPEVQMYHNRFLVDTGKIPDCSYAYGQELEAAYIRGPLSIEGECYSTSVEREQNQNNLRFNGYYMMMSYFLTGESYQYNFKEGNIVGLTPIRHCYGAFEIAFRYSTLELEEDNVNGGREYNKTYGLNWYPNENLKFVLNYICVHTHPSQNGIDRKLNIIAIRCQLSIF